MQTAWISFVHNRVFGSSQLRQAFAILDHDVFDTEKVRAGLDELRRLYASEGYINFTPVANTQANDQVGTVTLLIDVDEGKQFRIESLTLSGSWPKSDEEELVGIYRSYSGGVNVAELIEQFEAATQTMGLARNLVDVKQNADRGTVDVRILRTATRLASRGTRMVSCGRLL